MLHFTIRVFLQGPSPVRLCDVTAVVRILDTTSADAPARLVNECRVQHFDYDDANPSALTVSLRTPEPSDYRRWTVDAFIDVDGDGIPSVGDFVTKEAHPLKFEDSEVIVVAKRIELKA